MDAVPEIKARLPIEQLVGSYCQLQKKGRNFVALCPFHQDTHPSLIVSPDKGIAYCFACQKGGDIFSFYQAIEGVDFRGALKDLAERAGVRLTERPSRGPKKDEKDRIRACLEAAKEFYRAELAASEGARAYLRSRGVTEEQEEEFQLGFAPDSFSATYEELLKQGFSRTEIMQAGLGVQRDLAEERIYDRFRNRLIFPITDHQGNLVAFGGRTLGEDDAKYINSSEGPLYRKSQVLFGFAPARDAIRERRTAIVVEGYFDVLACHRVGVRNVVATSGTALTQEHAKLLKRICDTVTLCLDQDRAGQDAAERAFHILSTENLLVQLVVMPSKDPSELLQESPVALQQILEAQAIPYVDAALEQMRREDINDPIKRRSALERLLSLLSAITLAVEREALLTKAASLFGTTELALQEDLQRFSAMPAAHLTPASAPGASSDAFTKAEIALSLFILYPRMLPLLEEVIPPDEECAKAIYEALKSLRDEEAQLTLEQLPIPEEFRERVGILSLFAEHHGFGDWSDSIARREIRKNCQSANREFLHRKQLEITRELQQAHADGRIAEEETLQNQYQQLLKLAKMAG
jgi:DNA primase